MFKLKKSENQSAQTESKTSLSTPSVATVMMLRYLSKLESVFLNLKQHPKFQTFFKKVSTFSSQHIAIGMGGVIVIAGFMALHKPINDQQYARILEVAQQTQYVSSQQLAQRVLQRPIEGVRLKHVLKINAAVQFEAKRIQHYAPIQTSPVKTEFEYPEYE